MMLWVSLPVKNHLILVYLSGFVAATLLEYVTGYVMEMLFKVRYWDYSDQKYNLNGYICLSSSIAWGFLTILMTEVIHRPIEHLVLNLNPILEWSILVLITVPFLSDIIQSTKDALDLAQALEAATKLRGELDELQVQIALLKAELSQDIQEHREEREERLQTFRQELQEKTAAMRLQHTSRRRNILRRNPSAASRQFTAALKELKESFEEHNSRKRL